MSFVKGNFLRCVTLLLACSTTAFAWQADERNDDEQAAAAAPQLRLEAGGPTAFVTSLVFSPTSDALLIGGWDKLVDVWRAPQGGRWQRDAAGAFRIPIGPETWGAINAVAISPDGEQLAVGGKALARGVGDWQHPGWLVPTTGLVEEGLDRGTIYVFDVRTRQVRALRGHRGVIWALAYVSPARDGSRRLVSAAAEPDPRDSSKSWMVVRVWDADEGRHLAAGSMTPWPRDAWSRPALAAWSFGHGPKQIAVAVATGEPHVPAQGESATPGQRDNQCCLFNADTGRRYYAADGPYSRTVVYWEDGLPRPSGASRNGLGRPFSGVLITGSANKLTFWDVPQRADAPPTRKAELSLGAPAGQFRGVVPLAMSLVQRPDAKRMALVLRHVFRTGKEQVEDDRLQLVDLTTRQKIGTASHLWREGKTPALATSRDGAHLAVTGGKDHRVRIYHTSDLGAEQAKQWQAIGGEGERFVDAAFVRNGQRLGLLLIRSQQPKPRGRLPRQPMAGDLVFDADRGEVTGQIEGWQTLVADKAWTVAEGKAKHGPSGGLRRYLRVRHAGRDFGQPIWLPPLDELSDYAVLPPGGERQFPMLAVATHQLGEPSLYLYDARSGQRFRRLSGPVERLRSLAFHSDAALLVSTSDDQTVCVWSLLDWQECLGKRGWLAGLAVELRGGRLVVARNVSGEPIADGRLRPGDSLDALAEPDGRQPLLRPHDFYSALLRRKPGETITLISARGGAAAGALAIEVGQATDQRMPLVSLFFVKKPEPKQGEPDDFDWLGWSPSGVYDAGSPEIESRIGWHFNTGRAEAPVRYALAAEYARLRRAGLLPQLLHHPDQAPAPAEQPPPKLSLWIEPNDPHQNMPDVDDAGGVVRLADGDVTLRASLEGIDPGLVRSVGWRGPAGELHLMPAAASSSHEYLADLSREGWRRGRRQIECVVATNDVERPSISRSIVLSFLPPPPPTIKIVAPEASTSVAKEKRLRFRADVLPDVRRTVPVNLALVHLVDGQQKQRWQWSDVATVDQTLDLQPGENRLRLTAISGDAPAAEADRETAVVERKIYYQPQAPQLGLEVVANDEARLLGTKNKDTWEIEETTILVRGTIAAADKLAAAEWKWSEDKSWSPFHGFERGETEFRVEETIALEPGPRRLVCRAATIGARPSTDEVSLTINHRPPLPRLSPVGVAPRQIVEGAAPLEVVLSGDWADDERLRPFTLDTFRDDERSDSRVEIDEARRTFQVRAAVSPSAGNRFQIRVANKWRSELVDAPRVEVLRPPRTVDVEAPAQSREANVELRFTVESPSNRDLREIKVSSWPLPLESAVPDRGPEVTRWQVVAKNIPLQLGRNRLAIAARNDDGWAVRPAEAVVEVLAPPPPPPDIALESPSPGQTFAVPHCEIALRVTSSSRVARVALLHNGHHAAELDVTRQVGDGDGFRMEQKIKVVLPGSGPHVLSVLATNGGGSQRKERTVVYLPPPVEVLVDRIETPEPDGQVQAAELKDDGYRFAAPLSRGDVWLHGRVRWAEAAKAGEYPVAVAVNGYSQVPATLAPAADNPRERRWKAQLWLDRRLNRVDISLLDLVRDRGSRLSFEVGCAAPLENRRLHMLVIGIGEVDGEQLERDALAAVHAKPVEKGGSTDSLTRFTAPAFALGELRRPRIREIDPDGLIGRVNTMLREIRRKHGGEPGTDLFILYYRGLEAVEEGGRFYLQTSLSDDLEASLSDVSGDELEQLFERSLGAHLCLLDVKRSRRRGPTSIASASTRSSPTQHTGVLRSAWLRAGDRPDDAWLLVWFREAARGKSRLGDIRAEIDKLYQDYRDRYPGGLELDARIPSTLDDVVLAEP